MGLFGEILQLPGKIIGAVEDGIEEVLEEL